MITLPWQVVAGLIGLVAVAMILCYLKLSENKEIRRAELTEERRNAIASWREGVRLGFDDGQKFDSKERRQERREQRKDARQDGGDPWPDA